MNERYDRRALKLRAKELVGTTVPKAILVTLVFWLLTTGLSELVNLFAPFNSLNTLGEILSDPNLVAENPEMVVVMLRNMSGSLIIALFVSIALTLYKTVMSFGYYWYAMKVFRKKETGYNDLFAAFPMAGKAIGASILTFLIIFGWVMLGVMAVTVATVFFSMISRFFGILAMLGGSVGLAVLIIWLGFRYELVPMLLLDNPNMGVMEALRTSVSLMRGNIGNRFVLSLSFLGWDLLLTALSWSVILMISAATGTLQQAAALGDIQAAVNMLENGLPLWVSIVVTLPLNLWLTAYETTAQVGFYNIISHRMQPPKPEPGPTKW